MKETILLYNLADASVRNNIKFICVQLGLKIRTVEPTQYKIPVGTLALGNPEEIATHPATASEPEEVFDDPMLVFAGFTNRKLDQFLLLCRKRKVPQIPLKAVLTQENATWNSITLHRELAREDAAMRG